MEHQFWHEKWEKNELGFHQDQHHPLLTKYFPTLGVKENDRVFVPLCGKSRDLVCLGEMGYEVIGLELSEIAVQSFFLENKLDSEATDEGPYNRYRGEGIEILCGDFFALESNILGPVSAVFDRASLIAMPVEMRQRYAAQMQTLLTTGVQILLITLEYGPDTVNAPPFTVREQEVHGLYGSWCDIDLLEKAPAEVKGFACHELAWKIKVK